MDTHEEYTQELHDKISEEQEYFNNPKQKKEDLESGVVELGPLQDKPVTFYKTLEEALTHRNNVDNLPGTLDKNEEENPI